jgi:peptidyl-prolyl cis-trans isomerase D
MLRILRQGQRWIMGTVILIVGGVFVFFIGIGAPLTRNLQGDTVIDVDGRQYGAREVLRIRARQEDEYRRQLGDSFDPKVLGDRLDEIAANYLVQLAILSQEAERLGLGVSDDEMRDVVRGFTIFHDDQGRFRPDAYKSFVEYEYGTERLFKEALRTELAAQKLGRVIGAGASVSEVEARDALVRQGEEVDLALAVIDTKKLRPNLPGPTDEQAQGLLAKDEPRVRKAYDDNASRYHLPERVRARHVLIQLAKDAPADQEEKARAKAQEVLARLRKGDDFAKVAEEASDDPGSKTRGGDLGFFMRGQMVPPFEQAAFTLEPGALSDLVRSDFGFHVIRVEEKQAAQDKSFDDVKQELAKELAEQDLAGKDAQETADALAKAVGEGKALESAARDEGLTLTRPAALRRRPDGYVPGVGASPELLDAAFALTMEAPSSRRIFQVGDKLVLVQLQARRAPTDADLAKELPQARERMLEDTRARMQQSWIAGRRAALEQEGRLLVNLAALKGPISN